MGYPKVRALLVLLFVIQFICIKSYIAQQYGFYTFNEHNGLSKNTVLGINQLPNGDVYLGTHYGGVNILNGIDITVISEQNGLANNVVYDIVNLDEFTQLFATNDGITIAKNNVLSNPIYADSLLSKRTYTALENKQEELLLATGKGLAILKKDTVYAYKTKSELLDASPIIHIREDKNGSLWCATLRNGVFELKKNKEVIHYNLKDALEYSFCTFPYNDTTVWFLTYQGLYRLVNNKVEKVNHAFEKELSRAYFHYCIRDSKGNIWIATLKGVLRIDSKGKETLFTQKNGLAGKKAWKIMEDREGNIWIAFKSAGVSKLTNEAFCLYNKNWGISNEDIECIYLDSANNRWLGTKDGVVIVKKDTVEYLKYGKEDKDKIKAIKKTSVGMFCLSEGGVNILKEGRYINLNASGDETFKGSYIYESDNKILLASSVTGVAQFKNNKIVYINDSLGLERMGVYSIVKTKDNLWWYATEKGLYYHNGIELQKVKEEQGLSNKKVRSLVLDNNGKLWVGNGEGIYYKEKDKFYPVYKKDTMTNHTTYALCFDLEGNLWASKIDGLDKISIEQGEITSIRHYDSKKGFGIGSLFNNSMALDVSNGHILVGTDKGLLEIDPALDFPNMVEAKTRITSIQLFSQPTDWSIYTDSVDAFGLPINLELAYNQNYFTFSYIGVCHKFPKGVRYKCMLEGLDNNWVDRGDKRFVIYGNLKPGKYTFLLKASNNEGIWNKEPVRFSFVIHPPFWQTWWFYGICTAIVIGWIISYLKIRKANYEIRLKNEEIEEKNVEIMDSINYAKRIQDAMLPDSKMAFLLPKSFVFFQPKDVVSGDFYWLKRSGDKLLFAAVDCTGHGVPGAFVSMIGFSGLNRAVNEYKLSQPNEILENLSNFVVDAFAKHQSKSINDGMDASLACLDVSNRILNWAGANNSVYIIRKSDKPLVDLGGKKITTKDLGILKEIKATRRPIGKTDNPKPFENHVIKLEKGDRIYLFTDGFPDQFGGEKGKKYMYKAFKRFLISIQNVPIEDQGNRIKEEFERWTQGKHEQVDDICVLGVEIV